MGIRFKNYYSNYYLKTKLKKNPMYGKKRVHSEETIAKISNANIGKKRDKGVSSLAQKITVSDISTNVTTEYSSISTAAKALGIRQSAISTYFMVNQKKAYR